MTIVPGALPALVPAAIAVLVGWRMYRRVRRLVGRQPVRTRRLVATAILFPVLFVLVGLSGLRDATLLEALVAGGVAGVALGGYGLHLTRYEASDAGHFYVPNTAIGIAVSVLFIGRLVYRFGALYLTTGRLDPSTLQSFGNGALIQSPLTLAIFGVVAAYYTTFAIGILLWYRRTRSLRASSTKATMEATTAATTAATTKAAPAR